MHTKKPKIESDSDPSSDGGGGGSGYAKMEVYATFVAAFSFLCIGLLRAYTSPAIASMLKNPEIFNTTSLPQKEVISWIASSPPFASFIGTVLSGPLLQYCGRQTTIVLLTIPYIAGWLSLGFAQNIFMVLSGRILTGLAAGISTAAAQLYVSECVRPEVRGTLGFLPAMMLALGVLLGFSASTIDVEWRELALIMGTLPVLLFVMSLTIPESPPWLILRKRDAKATKNLERLRGDSVEFSEIEQEIDAMKAAISQQRRRRESRSSLGSYGSASVGGKSFGDKDNDVNPGFFKLVKKREIWLPAIIAVSLMMFQQFAGANVVIFFLSVILTEAEPIIKELPVGNLMNNGNNVLDNMNINSSVSNYLSNVTSSMNDNSLTVALKPTLDHNVSSVIVGLVQFLAFFLSLPLIDQLGRKILLISSAIMMTVPLGVLGLYFYCNVNSAVGNDMEDIVIATYSWLPLTCLCIFIAAYSCGFGPVPFIIMSEIFPSQARSYLCSMTSFVNHFALFIAVKMFPMFLDWIGPHYTFWMFGGFCMTSILFVIFVVPETKGKSLAEIEKQFAKEATPLLNRRDSEALGLP